MSTTDPARTAKTIGLCMIVKNEAAIVTRCLESARPLVDYVLVSDTGSTDGTQDVIQRWLNDARMPGMVSDEPWRDFAYNRSEALRMLRTNKSVDYAFIMDADDFLVLDPTFDAGVFKSNLREDVIDVELRHAQSASYFRPLICNNKLDFTYRGVLHEFLQSPDGANTRARAIGFYVASTREGARSKDPEKYLKDAKLLEGALLTEKDEFLRARYRFYLARSYADARQDEPALSNFLKRAELGYWAEEIFVSLYSSGRIMERLGKSFEDSISMYMRATEAVPARAEALHAASRLCRLRNRFSEGYKYARQGLSIAPPADGLFVELWVYDYGLLDELAVNAYWIGRYSECLEACQRLLREAKMPHEMGERVRRNAAFASGKLGEAQTLIERQPAAPTGDKKDWVPTSETAGTELMVSGLRDRLGSELDRVDLRVNHPGRDGFDGKPRIVWIHHDADQSWVQWCSDKDLVASVAFFVFVSYWQCQRYIQTFGIPPERCVVIRHAVDACHDKREWTSPPIWKCAYTSTPFRGLSTLLDAWDKLAPANAELHIWSSMKLYLLDDTPYRHLFDKARTMRGVVYHGLAPNDELRASLRTMHFLVYPCTFAETACLAIIEAMAAGCRVITSSLGALPETTAGYARLYPFQPDPSKHKDAFAGHLAEELDTPWAGDVLLSSAQQDHCRAVYGWDRCLRDWRHLIERANAGRRT
jgi:glycosyltransferase involved in cell wall biosynthesis